MAFSFDQAYCVSCQCYIFERKEKHVFPSPNYDILNEPSLSFKNFSAFSKSSGVSMPIVSVFVIPTFMQ